MSGNEPASPRTRVALAAFLLFAALLGAARADASLTKAADVADLSHPALQLPAVAPAEPSRFGFAEDLTLLNVEKEAPRFSLIEGVETRRFERTYARNNPLRFVDPDGRQSVEYLRRLAVEQAWAQERQLVINTGQGTTQWSMAQKQELISTGRVEGYIGHHINNVASRPDLAGNPANIELVTGPDHYLRHNSGRFRLPTSGALITRGVLGLQLAFIAVDAWSQYKDAKATGVSTSLLFGTTSIFDAGAAAKTLNGQYIDVSGTTYYAQDGAFYRAGCAGLGDDCKADSTKLEGRTFRTIQVY